MASTVTPAPYLAADLIGFSAGLVITLLLLVLTLRAARLPGTPYANILVVLCALTWNAGGLAHMILLGSRLAKTDRAVQLALAVQFTGAALWPLPLLTIWRTFTVRPAQQRLTRLLQGAAWLAAIALIASLWLTAIAGSGPLPIEIAKRFAAVSGAVLATGAVALLVGSPVSRAVWCSALMVLAGVAIATLSMLLHGVVAHAPHWAAVSRVGGQQSMLLVVLGGFFLFARFRFADLFIRHGLRVLAATLCAGLLAVVIEAPPDVARALGARMPPLFVTTLLLTAALLAFVAVERALVALVDRWIVRAGDHRQAARDLIDTLARATNPDAVSDAACAAVRATLELQDARVIPFERLPAHLWPAEVADGEIAELPEQAPVAQLLGLPDAEMLLPIRAAGLVCAVLVVAPGPARRGLVTHEVSFLRAVATQIGSRLDGLREEQQRSERQHQEALLRQQVAEAELRALRAQVDPHFLFNSLNTIADLIVTRPADAEAMTLRLAKVFRHLLAQTSRPMTTIRDEVDFLRTYLRIEEARFGDRLRVTIDVAPELALHPIPSLILQPIVENALTHGLAPKPGRGHLTIAARIEQERVCLIVEDDGMGVRPAANAGAAVGAERRTTGVGLTNVAQRLAVLYGERADVAIAPRESGGTRVTLHLPRHVDASVA